MNELLKGKIPIEMDKVKLDSSRIKKYILRSLFWVVFAVLVLFLTWLWVYFGNISTDYAIIDGESYVVVSPLEDTLQDILVSENQFVTQGQIVAKMSLANNNEAAIAQNILQNSNLIPDNLSNRVEFINKLEADIVARIAKLRTDENAKNKIYEQKVQAHVKAQLYLRNLNANLNLGEKANQSHISASKNVDKAKKEMDSAKLNFEETSMLRAAIESELMTMREQAKVANNRHINVANAYLDKIKNIKELSVIRAPAAGKVVKIFSEVGQRLISEQPILQIVPSSNNQRLAVVAYFSKDQLESIKVGQSCRVSLNLEEEIVLQGVVESIAVENHSAVPNNNVNEPKRYPIVIKLIAEKSENVLDIYPGMKATAMVYTRELFDFF